MKRFGVFFVVFLVFWSNLEVSGNTNFSLKDLIEMLEKQSSAVNVCFFETNYLYPIKFEQFKSLKVSFEMEEKQTVARSTFFMPYERRYEIILLVSIPTSYMVAKFLMEQVSFYNYRDNTRSLNTQQWAFVIASSIIIPLIVATEDYVKYREFVQTKLKF